MTSLVDLLLATALPLMAWRVLTADRLPIAVVLFIALGLLSAIAWARLDAPDVALVEAAVGAGLTGALLMSSLRFIAEPSPPRAWRTITVPLVAFGGAAVLAAVVATLPRDQGGLGALVSARLDESGVPQPVTAVLMNFRGHDTHLEMVVLVTAAVAVRALYDARASAHPATEPVSPLLVTLVQLLLPVVVVVAGYLVWSGSHAPGGAFQAGAILAGGAVLSMLARRMKPPTMASPLVRRMLLTGPLLFFGMAAAPLFASRSLLEYPRPWAGTLIFALECALAIAIATVLAMFFPEGFRGRRPGEG